MDILPPPTFDHPYKGHLIERLGSLAEVKHYCHTMHGIVSAYQALGCAKVFPRRCFVMIPKVGGQITARMQARNPSPRDRALQRLGGRPSALIAALYRHHSSATETAMRLNFSGLEFLSRSLTVLAFAVGLSLSSTASAEPKDEIAAIAKEWAAAFSEHNVDRILKLYSKDALLWGTNGMTLRTTPEEVRGFFESAFKIPNISGFIRQSDHPDLRQCSRGGGRLHVHRAPTRWPESGQPGALQLYPDQGRRALGDRRPQFLADAGTARADTADVSLPAAAARH